MPDESVEHVTMSLGDHLEELRWRLILGLLGPVIGAVLMLIVGKDVLAILVQPLLYALAAADLEPTLYVSRVPAAFAVYMRIAVIGGLILGIPWLFYQLWRFIAPGLYRRERRLVVYMIPFSAALAATGLAFMYYIMLPVTLWFLIQFTITLPNPSMEGTAIQDRISAQSDEAREDDASARGTVPADGPPLILPRRLTDPVNPPEGATWINVSDKSLKWVADGQVLAVSGARRSNMTSPWFTLDEYVSFVLALAMAFALAFQLPLVMLMLAWMGLAQRVWLAKMRKYALLGCFVLAAVLTPPDLFSQILLAVPMYLLFEFGLLLMRMVERAGGRSTPDGEAT